MIKTRLVSVTTRNVNWWTPSGYSINKSTISDNISMKKTWKIIKSNAGYILQTKSDSLLSLKKMQKQCNLS